MTNMQALLIEIGVEEIPAGVAPCMGDALRKALQTLLENARLNDVQLALGVTPRRLLIHAKACPVMQSDKEETIWGPPEKVAYADGKPTGAATGFAKKLGLNLSDFTLADKDDSKGLYMCAERTVKGRKVATIIAEAMPDILRKLPSPKQMQWQDGNTRSDAFIRPIRWIVARLGDETIPFSFAGISTGTESQGHRIQGGLGDISVDDPFAWLESQCVLANRDTRKQRIADQLHKAAKSVSVIPVEDNALLEEITDLTEWPQVITGRYQEDFLRLPEKVAQIELKNHQRCFATKDKSGQPSNVFFAVANIESKDPQAVAHGNERVVNARLSDAAFYFDRDPKESLETRIESLSGIVFQDGLGMVGDQIGRLRGFVLDNADKLNVDANDAQRAAYLCKSDLTTGLVGEFPELQGYMGGIYGKMDGENDAVCQAITEHYQPEGADDALPARAIARAIGISERADKLLGYFHLKKIPTASADPFGLRRAAIGLIRLLADESTLMQMTLSDVLSESVKQWNQQRVTTAIDTDTGKTVRAFIVERLLGMAGIFRVSKPALDAALHAATELPLYRNIAVAKLLTSFADSDAGQAVAAANKRIANILKKAENVSENIDAGLFEEDAEKSLFAALQTLSESFPDTPEAQLDALASLREPVDTFFDNVMVMTENKAVKDNRLALLGNLRALFLRLADVSRL